MDASFSYISQPVGVETTANHQTGKYLFFFCLLFLEVLFEAAPTGSVFLQK